MYRLLKLRNTNITPLRGVSSHTQIINERTCNLCKRIHNAGKTQVSFQSTHTSPQIAPKKGRKKRVCKKNYTDMLIVKESSASEVRARVKNLKPNDIKILALTNLKLNELYKLKDFLKMNPSFSLTEHSYSNLADFSNIALQEEAASIPVEYEKTELEISPKQLETEIEEEMEAVIEQTDELLHKCCNKLN